MARQVDLVKEPRGAAYLELLELAKMGACSLLLVVRDGLGLSDGGMAMLKLLEPFLIRQYRTSSWPGTQLLKEEATVLEYRYCGAVAYQLRRSARGLFDWQQPALPEDPCFLRQDGTPWLVTISHERDAFFYAVDGDPLPDSDVAPHLAACLEEGGDADHTVPSFSQDQG